MFDIHQSVYSSDGAEMDESRVADYIHGLMEEFAASPEAQPLIEQHGKVGWAAMMMDYAFSYIGSSVPKLSVADCNEVVFDLFPRKVSTEAETAFEIIAELRAFWDFVYRQYGMANARAIRATLTDNAVARLKAALSNPRNFGPAKSFVMAGMQAGFDMTTQEGAEAFQAVYNAAILADRMARLPPEPSFLGGGGFDPGWIGVLPPRKIDRETKRKQRKAQRQARKRNRK
jgi:hypothetical protein